MENSFFIFTDGNKTVQLERFHICTWEFNDSGSLIEFGAEINKDSINEEEINIKLLIPWLTKECKIEDLYPRLKDAKNSRFIFNDSISGTDYLNDGASGVIHKFSDRQRLCIIPSEADSKEENIISIKLDLKDYKKYYTENEKTNVYFRFCIKPSSSYISIRKKGISKSTIIYDIKINEKRNIPNNKTQYFNNKNLCKIDNCFCFNIIPNEYDIVFFENISLKNVRTLEYESFNQYIGDKRIKKDDLVVVFNKKQKSDSFSFFCIYSKERIGTTQFVFAILINMLCGVLLSLPINDFKSIPSNVKLVIGVILVTVLYFIYPIIIAQFTSKIKKRFKI